jgi:hypothetical protein
MPLTPNRFSGDILFVEKLPNTPDLYFQQGFYGFKNYLSLLLAIHVFLLLDVSKYMYYISFYRRSCKIARAFSCREQKNWNRSAKITKTGKQGVEIKKRQGRPTYASPPGATPLIINDGKFIWSTFGNYPKLRKKGGECVFLIAFVMKPICKR